MISIAARLAAARLGLAELPAALSVTQAARLLADATATAAQWQRLLRGALVAGELVGELVEPPVRRYERLDNMAAVERANRERRAERKLTVAELGDWLRQSGAALPPWLAEVQMSQQAARTLSHALRREVLG